VRQQLIFEMRPKVRMRQGTVKSRTLRQLAGDLSDLEGELAKRNTTLFQKTGLSWVRPDIEGVWSSWGKLGAMADQGSVEESDVTKVWLESRALPRHRARIDLRFPSEVSSIDRLVEDRRLILGRMAVRDRDVEYELQRWPQETPGQFQGPGINWDRVEDFNPWTYMDEVKFPFPDPFFFETLFGPDIDWDSDVDRTPQYEAVFPWFYNDVDEFMVAQLDSDLRDTIPWDMSANAWMMRSKKREPHPNSLCADILNRVKTARARRARFAGQIRDKGFSGPQLALFGGDDAVQVPVDVRPENERVEDPARVVRHAAEGGVLLGARARR